MLNVHPSHQISEQSPTSLASLNFPLQSIPLPGVAGTAPPNLALARHGGVYHFTLLIGETVNMSHFSNGALVSLQ